MGLHAIRRIYEHGTQASQAALAQCKQIMFSQFPHMSESEADEILHHAGKTQHPDFLYVVLVAENRNKQVLGVAIASHFQKLNFYFLDFIATHQQRVSGGIGGALYGRLREEAHESGCNGIFFDCLPDDRALSESESEFKQNVARLRFYERFGAFPLTGLNYSEPRLDHSRFLLVFDGLGKPGNIPAKEGRQIVKSILEAKAQKKCPPAYVTQVVKSIVGPLKPRLARYSSGDQKHDVSRAVPDDKKIVLVVNEGHLIHHVRERGYLESPVRVNSILREIGKLDFIKKIPAAKHPIHRIEEVHDKNYLSFLRSVCEKIGNNNTLYGDVFPIRNAARLPKDVELQIGYYCIDTSTPLNANAYIAARGAANCALTAADAIMKGANLAYALVRPPGHHAERKYFGGFCYLNSSAIAAQRFSKEGKVALLDIDYHHGNGQQDIFYERSDVFTVSIHGDPGYAYPNFTGFADETGEGSGAGFNLNIPLPKHIEGSAYRKALKEALSTIADFSPAYFVIALGLDTAKGDPTGTWSLTPQDLYQNGKLVSSMKLPTLVVQEGGYQNRVLGRNARYFFQGLWDGYFK